MGEKRRIKTYYVQAQIPYDHYVYQKHINKINLKKIKLGQT